MATITKDNSVSGHSTHRTVSTIKDAFITLSFGVVVTQQQISRKTKILLVMLIKKMSSTFTAVLK